MFGCRGCHSVRVAAVDLTFVVVSIVIVVVGVVDVHDVKVAVVVVSVVVDVLDPQAAVMVESAKSSPSWDTSTGQLRRCQDRRANWKGMGRSTYCHLRWCAAPFVGGWGGLCVVSVAR